MRLQPSFRHDENIEKIIRENIAEFSEVGKEGLTIDVTKRNKTSSRPRNGRTSFFPPFYNDIETDVAFSSRGLSLFCSRSRRGEVRHKERIPCIRYGTRSRVQNRSFRSWCWELMRVDQQ